MDFIPNTSNMEPSKIYIKTKRFNISLQNGLDKSRSGSIIKVIYLEIFTLVI